MSRKLFFLLFLLTLGSAGCGSSEDRGFEPVDPPTIPPSSSAPVCGNARVEGTEACDDGNLIVADGCSATCQIESNYTCTAIAGTRSTCTRLGTTASCGNGSLETPEVCDDGNTVSGDGCTNLCQSEMGFSCTGAAGSRSVCTSISPPTPPPSGCGNSRREGTEVCDDGNLVPGDGCNASCQTESGFDCYGVPGGATVCRVSVGVVPVMPVESCGNGLLGGTESCDDGNTESGDGCKPDCRVESGYSCSVSAGALSVCTRGSSFPGAVCGNGRREGFESCDDANTSNGDGCNNRCDIEQSYTCTAVAGALSTCTRGSSTPTPVTPVAPTTGCGNGRLEGTEMCDDGNLVGGDGCKSNCNTESAYTCTNVVGARSVCTRRPTTPPVATCYNYAYASGNEVLTQNTCGGGSRMARVPAPYHNIRDLQISSLGTRLAFSASQTVLGIEVSQVFVSEVQSEETLRVNVNGQILATRPVINASQASFPFWTRGSDAELNFYIQGPALYDDSANGGSRTTLTMFGDVRSVDINRMTRASVSGEAVFGFATGQTLDSVWINALGASYYRITGMKRAPHTSGPFVDKLFVSLTTPFGPTADRARNELFVVDTEPPPADPTYQTRHPIIEVTAGGYVPDLVHGIDPDDFSLSPDGAKLAFTRDNNLYVCDLLSAYGSNFSLQSTGTNFNSSAFRVVCLNSHVIFNQGQSKSPCWSSDGRKIFLQNDYNGESRIMNIDPANDNAFQLLHPGTSPTCLVP